jgi:hypothetical protein
VVTARAEPKHGTVYVLKDPRDLQVRYVGATTVSLAARLEGHLSRPSSEPLREWIADLKTAGLVPIIEPLRKRVPVASLDAVETAEIHRRTMRREPLLNIIGTAAALKILREREAAKARRRELALWWATGARIRAMTGPLAPGFDTPVGLSDETWNAVDAVATIHDAMTDADRQPPKPRHEISDPDNYVSERAELMINFGYAVDNAHRLLAEEAWTMGFDGRWGFWNDKVRECVEAAAGNRHFADAAEAGRYLALISWYLSVIPPWRQLAYRCGIPPSGPEFHAWVTDDEDVRTALLIVEKREPFVGRAADDISRVADAGSEPGLLEILDVLTVVYSRRTPEPGPVGRVLRFFARDGQLDERMAKVLLRVDPDALDRVYGPDHATRIDSEFNLPVGTAGAVVRRLSQLMRNNEGIDRLVQRIDAELPVATLPDIKSDWGPAPTIRAMIGGLIAAGRIKAPEADATEYLARVRRRWTPGSATSWRPIGGDIGNANAAARRP